MKTNMHARYVLTVVSALVCLGAMTVSSALAITLPPGTEVQVRINDKLDTGVAQPGETFTGTVTEPVVVNGRTVIASGTKVSGQIVEAISSGRLKKPASITLELTQAGSRSVSTAFVKIDGKSHLVRNTEFIGGGAAAGAIIGAITGGKKGAVVGGAAGAGAGTVGAFLTGKKEIAIPAETILPFVVPGGGENPAPATVNTRQPAAQPTPTQTYNPPPAPAPSYNPPRRAGYRGESYSQPYFSEVDQRLVRRYYSSGNSNLPPGLAKRGGNLPPGLEKQVERNGTLPPGLQKRVEPFPEDLNRQMPRLPRGCYRVFLGDRALIVDQNNRVLDVMNVRGGEDDQGRGHGKGRGRGHGHGHEDKD
jgi:hypothetical protein